MHLLVRLSMIPFSTAQQTLPFHLKHYGLFFGWRRPAPNQSPLTTRPLTLPGWAPDTRAGGGAHEMESRLSTLATCGFGVRTSLEATTG